MTRMYNPPHPGEVLRDGVFNGTGNTVADFARRIGGTRVTLSIPGAAVLNLTLAVNHRSGRYSRYRPLSAHDRHNRALKYRGGVGETAEIYPLPR